ncbi:MAG: hypothetical protein ACXW31_08645, partial [Thermoanaerobaculia bacterium]
WRIEAERHREARQTYQRNTNILVTRVTADDGVFDVYDFAPWVDKGYTMDAPVQLVRLLVPVEGNPRFRVTFEPAPDYARRRPEYVMRTRAVEVRGHGCDVTLFSDIPIDYVLNGSMVRLDRPRYMALCTEGGVDSTEDAIHLRDQTAWSWVSWVKSCSVPDYHPDAVVRSALCLKLHQYAPTGSIIVQLMRSGRHDDRSLLGNAGGDGTRHSVTVTESSARGLLPTRSTTRYRPG